MAPINYLDSLSTTNSSTGLKNLTFQVSSDPTLTLSQYKLYRARLFWPIPTPHHPLIHPKWGNAPASNPQEYHLEAFVAGSQQTGLNVTTDLNEAGVVLSRHGHDSDPHQLAADHLLSFQNPNSINTLISLTNP